MITHDHFVSDRLDFFRRRLSAFRVENQKKYMKDSGLGKTSKLLGEKSLSRALDDVSNDRKSSSSRVLGKLGKAKVSRDEQQQSVNIRYNASV